MVVTQSFKDIFDALSQIQSVNLPTLKENGLKIEFSKDDEIKTVYRDLQTSLPFGNSDVFNANISSWKRLTSENEGCKAVYEVTFDIMGSNFNFKAGDTIGILPHNIPSEVETVLKHLDLVSKASMPYSLTVNNSIKGIKIPLHVPVKSTLRHVLSFCVDLRAVLKKLFILALSRYTKDETERRVLEYLCSKEGASSYQTHILNKKLTLTNIFQIFKTCKPPIEVILANVPRLLPRPYSIVNSGVKDPNLIKICFSVMNIGDNRKGLTTGWLEELISKEYDLESGLKNLTISEEGCFSKVPIYIRKNVLGFTLPENVESPMLLIGPGTGVAPFLGFLEEMKMYKEANPTSKVGEMWLYFGCRNAKLDFIYEKELDGYLKEGVLTKLRTAFSRMEDSEFKYIQDALYKDGESIVKLIKNGAHIFICGDSKTLASQVKEILVKCLVKYDGKSQEDAEEYICSMQKEKRYLVDAWS